MPAHTGLNARAFADEILAMVDQQPQLAVRAVQRRGREIGLSPRRPGNSHRVDRVGLPSLPGAATGVGHQFRRDACQRLPGPQQVGLEPAGEMTAVLHGPSPPRPLRRPLERDQVPVGGRLHRRDANLATEPVAGHERVGALVRVNADHNLEVVVQAVLPSVGIIEGARRPDGRTCLSGSLARLL